jgi:glycyl-tRNA synthetase beta subunit
MNPYVIGGVALIIAIMGWQLKSSITRNGELTAKLEAQASETIEAADANATNQATITGLEARIKDMIEDRRIDAELRERVLDEREQELIAANARADQLQDERDDEIDTNPDCADLASLSLDMFCPAAAHQLRERSVSEGRNGDTDSN